LKRSLSIVGFSLLIIAPIVRADRVEDLIAQLADADSNVRQQAETGLTGMGEKARPALVKASRSDSPAIASSAARVLLAQSWFRPEDPTQAKQFLAEYGNADEPGRIMIANQISDMGRPGVPILLRLITEDPSEDVCWKIVTCLRNRRDTRTQELIRRLEPSDAQPAALVLVARAWEFQNRDKALVLLRRAIEAERIRRSYDDSELDYAFELLCKVAAGKGDYDEAAGLRRMQAERIGVTRDSYPMPVFQLFVLHGKYGPLSGFQDDLRTYQQYLGTPQVLYALSRACERAGRAIEAKAYADAALASAFEPADSPSASERHLVMSFLDSVGWTDLERREAYAVLANDSPDSVDDRLNARLRLLDLADDEKDDAQAIEQLNALTGLIEQRNPASRETAQRSLQANIVYRKARQAQARGDTAEANKQIDALVALAPLEHRVLLEACPVVNALGRRDDATKLFAPVYEAARQDLDRNPTVPLEMNNVAWLCAQCDQRLEEALELATQAVKAEPDNSAYLDTLADIQFRLGYAEEAVKLETRALELEPGDPFMTKQLNRFKAAPPK
jgi:tetratricopeptide (TPR) repeat protein